MREDTARIVAEAERESFRRRLGWRPLHATALMAMAEPPKGHVWMTPAEFAAFLARHNMQLGARGGRDKLRADLGIGVGARDSLLSGERAVSRPDALAFAHYDCGLPLPVPARDVDAFAHWMTRFGAGVDALNDVLGFSENYISDRMRGYRMMHGRQVRKPEPALIRAIDWVWRIGPFSPYGDRLPAPPFPQKETP